VRKLALDTSPIDSILDMVKYVINLMNGSNMQKLADE